MKLKTLPRYKTSAPTYGRLPAAVQAAAIAPPAPVTAADRGPEWIARYDCTDWCVMDHAGADGDPGWHQGPESTVMAPKPGSEARPGETAEVLMSVRVTQMNDNPKAFGIKTRVWLDTGGDSVEMTVQDTDNLIGQLEEFLPRLRAARELLVKASADDRPGDAAAEKRYMAELDARIKAINAAEVTV